MDRTSSAYDAACEAALHNPEAYWGEAARAIAWTRPYDRVFDPDQGAYGRWFVGGELNTAYNCLDRHVEAGRGDQPALIWDSPMTGRCETFTYSQLTSEVARMAGALAAHGVRKGDRVILYMPMIPQAVMAMLACARLGAIHSVVFGGFAAPELAKRIEDAQPRVIVTASCGLEPGRVIAYKPILDAAIETSACKPERVLMLQRPMLQAEMLPGRDFDLEEALAAAAPHDPVPVLATDPLYILYTSGTTGRPKGIIRDNGGHAVALQRSIGMIYGLQAGDVMFTASDVGWVVGHSYIVYGPLLAGLTTILYEGKPVGTPDPGAFWRVASQHGAKVMFTAPTALRAIKQQDAAGEHLRRYDLSKFEALFLAGERCDPPTAVWIGDLLGKPIVDHWWQTETGWAITAGCRGFGLPPSKPGSGGRPTPGYDVRALDDHGEDVGRDVSGNLCVRLPLPPGCAPGLWGDDDWYRNTYLVDYPGWYRTGDAGVIDADGDVFVMGRTDDIINVAGHRLSTGAMEEVIAAHPDVAECAVIGAADALKGQTPMGLIVLKAGAGRPRTTIVEELVAMVRERIGPVASFREVRVAPKLPKTRSGKILRATIRRIVDGESVATPPTIEDPAVLTDLAALFRRPPMKALVVERTEAGAPRAELRDHYETGLGDGEVLIRVSHSALNYKDGLAIARGAPVVRNWPMIPGIDLAGVVAESSHPDWKPGDPVVVTGWGMGETRLGGYAQYARVPAEWIVRLPEGLTAAQAMAVGTAGFTAVQSLLALERHGMVPAQGPLLVTGAAGGVGSVAVALAAKAGWRVIASTGRAAEADYLRDLGAAEILDRAQLSGAGRPLGPERWAAAIDTVGSQTLANVLSQTKNDGAVAACGLAQGMDLPATVAPFILRGVALFGINSVYAPQALRRAVWDRVARDLDLDKLAAMTRTVPLAEVIDLAPRILAGEIRGRTVVEVP